MQKALCLVLKESDGRNRYPDPTGLTDHARPLGYKMYLNLPMVYVNSDSLATESAVMSVNFTGLN